MCCGRRAARADGSRVTRPETTVMSAGDSPSRRPAGLRGRRVSCKKKGPPARRRVPVVSRTVLHGLDPRPGHARSRTPVPERWSAGAEQARRPASEGRPFAWMRPCDGAGTLSRDGREVLAAGHVSSRRRGKKLSTVLRRAYSYQCTMRMLDVHAHALAGVRACQSVNVLLLRRAICLRTLDLVRRQVSPLHLRAYAERVVAFI